MLGHRVCGRVILLAHVISQWFVLPLVLPLGLSVLHMVSCTQTLLLFLSLFHQGSHLVLSAVMSSEEEQTALGGSSWLADQVSRDFS